MQKGLALRVGNSMLTLRKGLSITSTQIEKAKAVTETHLQMIPDMKIILYKFHLGNVFQTT